MSRLRYFDEAYGRLKHGRPELRSQYIRNKWTTVRLKNIYAIYYRHQFVDEFTERFLEEILCPDSKLLK